MAEHTGATDADHRGTAAWTVLASSARGAAHGATGLPNQDACAWVVAGDAAAVVVAVADGHGHPRHFRAGRGARAGGGRGLPQRGRAVRGRSKPSDRAPSARPARGACSCRTSLPPGARRWRPTGPRRRSRWRRTRSGCATDDDPVIAYGATLAPGRLGRALGAGGPDRRRRRGRPPGRRRGRGPGARRPHARRALHDQPVPGDGGRVVPARRDRRRSRAGGPPAGDRRLRQRAGVRIPGRRRSVPTSSRCCARTARAWVAEQLPTWVERCASKEGSGDDTTVVLAVRRP